ncbi:MAG: hypothetical protein CVV23_01840 [Ignavibacteriae bacterium HGW-Ignavibacteriae-2]|jgi:hypothetical protein|nr:MAG: hypothetical protein CVV23_01840 [Ignavibacteriae bacterium HGW-Ignavibacteriae-2]
MVFLNPAVLLGLIASSIPILIHLLNLRKLKKVEFSTLSFLKELQKSKIRRVKLKQWILLVIRVLIILTLVAAFARPAFESLSFGVASSAKTSAVIIIDNTFSMSVIGDNGTYLNEAKYKAVKLLNEFQQGDEVTVLPVSCLEQPVSTTTNMSLAKKWLNSLEINYCSKDLEEQISKAFSILSRSNNFNKEIYVFSDFQKDRTFTEKHTGAKRETENIKLYYIPMHGKEIQNSAITSLEVKNQIFQVNKNISFTATITNYSSNSAQDNVISLFINGKRSAQRSFDIDANQTTQVEFEATIPESGLLEIFAELEDDDILSDNKRFIGIFVPEKISILALAGQPNDLMFIKAAFTSGDSGSFIFTEDKDTRVNAYNLADYNTIILSGGDYSRNLEKITQYVENGGSLIVMPGSADRISVLSDLCRSLKLPVPQSLIKNDNSNSYVEFEKTDLTHPVFTDLFEKENKQISSPRIYNYIKVFNNGNGRNIIGLTDGTTFLSEYAFGDGKVMMFNVAPDLRWSDFPVKGIFAPLLNKSIYYLSSSNKINKNYIVGDILLVEATKIGSSQIKVVKTDNNEEFIQPQVKKTNNTFEYTNSDVLAVYKFFSGDKLFDNISVNFDSRESNTKYFDSIQIEERINSYYNGVDVIRISENENISDKIKQARFGTELWKTLVIIVLLLAILEMWISRSSKKDLAKI